MRGHSTAGRGHLRPRRSARDAPSAATCDEGNGWARCQDPAILKHVLNQSPPYVDVDLYGSDQPLRDAVAGTGAESTLRCWRSSAAIGDTAEMFDLAREANENPPKLRRFDPRGFRLDIVEFHPAYHHFMASSISVGLHASTWRSDAGPAAPPAQVLRAARFYMAAQIETGHLCPITMTRAALAALAVEPGLATGSLARQFFRASTIGALCRGGRKRASRLEWE